MDVLERSLAEVREQRRKLELRLLRVRRDLVRLRMVAEAVVDASRVNSRPEIVHAASRTSLHNR
jgi:hypothetical protein